jgi:hypothetical protein
MQVMAQKASAIMARSAFNPMDFPRLKISIFHFCLYGELSGNISYE